MFTFGRPAKKPRPKRRIIRALPPPPVPTTTQDNSDSAAVLMEIKRGVVPSLHAQYMALAPTDPGARGVLKLQMTVDKSGTVSDLQVVEDTLQSAAFRRRVLATVQHWRYPTLSSDVDVSFPFVFG